MSYDIFSKYGLDKIRDTEDGDVKHASDWELVSRKSVMDSDGFMTEYSWYTDGSKHIFMFGDSDIYEPDPDYADWEAETEEEAKNWFDNYHGFEDDDFEDDDFDNTPVGNADFMNEGFDRVYGIKNTSLNETYNRSVNRKIHG